MKLYIKKKTTDRTGRMSKSSKLLDNMTDTEFLQALEDRKEKHRLYMREWYKKKRESDPEYYKKHLEIASKNIQSKREDESFREREREYHQTRRNAIKERLEKIKNLPY